ncbi:hypothetical protein HGO21_43965 [Acinetobacter sp. CUI P1]|nr:hypothetical protein [Acinetobacter sp. CUI P1]
MSYLFLSCTEKIDVKNNSLLIDFNADALQRLKSGYPLIEPDASVQE